MYLCYTLIVISVFLFLHGFFPVTKSIKHINNEPPTHINNVKFHQHLFKSEIEKTVLIIIDALRLDFIDPQYMPLTSHLIQNNGCCSTVTVESPTVTLPRIKALTAGNVPQFIDLVLNLASNEILYDSFIHSLLKKGKKVVFYGDDTWLKLFPNYFIRHEGTTSFYVRDFKEVDDNVTRNVQNELENHDWDVMILHYLGINIFFRTILTNYFKIALHLNIIKKAFSKYRYQLIIEKIYQLLTFNIAGLDHIGHVYGPFSSHIPNKLKEMDEIIYNIYSRLLKINEKTLLIVTGDHGMRDSGGHGGSSYYETHVPLLMIGINCVNGSLFQIDLPVNVAVLLGLSIPSTSIGQVRENLLPIDLEKYLFALRYNNLLLMNKANICHDHFLLATEFHEMYIRKFDKSHAWKAIDLYKNCSRVISEYLIKVSVKQNSYSLIIALLIMLNLLMILISMLFTETRDTNIYLNKKNVEYLIYLTISFIELFISIPICSLICMATLIYFFIKKLLLFIRRKYIYHNSGYFVKSLLIINIIHPLTFLSSSFVEEEHLFWYYIFSSLVIYILLAANIWSTKLLLLPLVLSIFRFIIAINSTGDKWANYPDFSDWLLESQNSFYYQLFFILGLVANFFTCTWLSKNNVKVNVLHFVILTCIFVIKSMDYESVLLGKLIWLLILYNAIFFYDCPKIVVWILISSLLVKPYNLILISFCVLTSISLLKVCDSIVVITFCHFWLGNALYFIQGHSNSLASVDISVGYIGLSEYQPLLVIVQVLCHIYAFPILCHFLLLRCKKIKFNMFWTILFCNRLYITFITCIVTTIFKDHLFVWSVFAPKLFIESIHIGFLFIESCIYFCYQHLCYILNMNYF